MQRIPSRLGPGSALPIAILVALLGLAAVLAYQAMDAARSEARAARRELRGYTAVAALQLAGRLEGYVAAHPGRPVAEVAAIGARQLLAREPALLGLPPGEGHPLWVELRDPRGAVLYRTPGWAPQPALHGSWLEAKVGWYGAESAHLGAVADTLEGALAGYTTRVALRGLPPGGVGGAGSRLPLLLTAFGLSLALVGSAIVQLRRQQQLVRLRDDFVSGVSHELRTPLAQIRLFADLLESGRLASAAQRERSVRVIAQESRRLSYLVENILHFSRGQRGGQRLATEPTGVADWVREAVDAFAPLAHAAGNTLRLELEEGIVVRVDRDAMRQVLLNLLDNAVKYGPAGQRVTVGSRLRGFALHLWVDDQGPGVPVAERHRVWEPYRRLPRDARSAVAGSGIGLSVVRDLVELHGGRVQVEAAPGGGARFLVVIPGAMYAGPLPAEAADAALEAG